MSVNVKIMLLIGATLLFPNLKFKEKKMEEKKTNIVGLSLILMIFAVITVALAFAFTGCTYSITMVHTEGAAQDVVDETATNTPSTSVTVPISAVPK